MTAIVSDGLIGQPDPDDVGRLARGAAVWVLVLLIARQLITLGTTMIVSRLVSPADVGLVGMVSTFVAFAVLFDTGLTWATVQAHDLTKEQVDSLFWLGVLLGVGLWGICVAAGPVLASFYREPRLATISAIMGLSVFFNSLTTQPSALLKRAMRQKTNNALDTVAIVCSCIIGISTAANRWGYWAIISQLVSMQAFRFLLLSFFSGYRLVWPRMSRRAGSLVRTGGLLAISNYVCFLQLYVGSIVIGRLFGPESLGFYLKATALKALPTMYAAMVVTDVMVSSLSVFQGDRERMGAAYRKALRLIAFVGCPVGAMLFPLSRELVQLLYGPQWDKAVPLLQWLALPAMMLPITTTTIWLFLAAGKAREQLTMNLCLSLATLVVYAIAALRISSVNGFVVLEVVLFASLFSSVNMVVSHRVTHLRIQHTLRVIFPIILFSTISSAVVYLLTRPFDLSWSLAESLIVKGMLGMVMYLSLSIALNRPFPVAGIEKVLSRYAFIPQ